MHNYEEALSEVKAGKKHSNNNSYEKVQHDVSGLFAKYKQIACNNDYIIPENKQYLIVKKDRNAIGDKIETRYFVFVLCEPKNLKERLAGIKNPARNAGMRFFYDKEMTELFNKQCDYKKPVNLPYIKKFDNGKTFECYANYLINGVEISFRIDELEKRKLNGNLEENTPCLNLLTQLQLDLTPCKMNKIKR